MPRRRRSKSLAVQAFELGMAAPQVIAHRMAACDAVEFQRMCTEKIAAANEAWVAMATQALLENPWSPSSAAALRILAKGMAPIRRRAVANAKRLRRSSRPSRTRR